VRKGEEFGNDLVPVPERETLLGIAAAHAVEFQDDRDDGGEEDFSATTRTTEVGLLALCCIKAAGWGTSNLRFHVHGPWVHATENASRSACWNKKIP